MLKENKWKIIISTLVSLIPILIGILLWDRLPETIATHFNIHGEPDGYSSKAFTVFALPLFLAALNLLCFFVTSLDPKQKGQNRKAFGIIFWIVPVISLVVCSLTYAIALGVEINMTVIMPFILGIAFIIIGNYLPKTKQNYTLGIKLPWTLNDEENWNKTHRLGGKLWVIGGVLIMLTALLPIKILLFVDLAIILILCIVPAIYSYVLHKKR